MPLEYRRVCAGLRLRPPSWSLASRLLYRFLAQLAGLAVRWGRWKNEPFRFIDEGNEFEGNEFDDELHEDEEDEFDADELDEED